MTAFSVVQQAIGEKEKEKPKEKNPAAVTLGKLGGLKGGPARAQKLSPGKRKAIATKAARARWGKPVRRPASGPLSAEHRDQLLATRDSSIDAVHEDIRHK